MEAVFAFLIIVVGVFGTLGGGADYLSGRSCDIYAEQTGLETKYHHFDSCFVKTPSGWMRWDEYKARAFTNTIRNPNQ